MREEKIDSYELLQKKMQSLVIFRKLLNDPVISSLQSLLKSVAENTEDVYSCYGEFVNRLFQENFNLTDYIRERMVEDANCYAVVKARGKQVPAQLEQAVHEEVALLNQVAHIEAEELIDFIGQWSGNAKVLENSARWWCSPVNLNEAYWDYRREIHKKGYGVFAKYGSFVMEDDQKLHPITNTEHVPIDQLVGYEYQRGIVIENTRALLAGKPAANILLYGDRGTGKSTTVKSVFYLLKREGLRLIEIKKEQLKELPTLLDSLYWNPLKFILFIDDLSFYQNDDNFAALKAVLEGSVSGRPANVVVYATSNRRHLVKENFSDREGDEVHVADTIEEMMSLSDRFGISLTFEKPDKGLYLSIVAKMARDSGIEMPQEELERQAERFAILRGGRSPRTARQFVDQLQAVSGKITADESSI